MLELWIPVGFTSVCNHAVRSFMIRLRNVPTRPADAEPLVVAAEAPSVLRQPPMDGHHHLRPVSATQLIGRSA